MLRKKVSLIFFPPNDMPEFDIYFSDCVLGCVRVCVHTFNVCQNVCMYVVHLYTHIPCTVTLSFSISKVCGYLSRKV